MFMIYLSYKNIILVIKCVLQARAICIHQAHPSRAGLLCHNLVYFQMNKTLFEIFGEFYERFFSISMRESNEFKIKL